MYNTVYMYVSREGRTFYYWDCRNFEHLGYKYEIICCFRFKNNKGNPNIITDKKLVPFKYFSMNEVDFVQRRRKSFFEKIFSIKDWIPALFENKT